MKDDTQFKVIVLFLNIFVFAYSGLHVAYSIIDWKIGSHVSGAICDGSSRTQCLCRGDGYFDYCGNLTTATEFNYFIVIGGGMCFCMWVFLNGLYFYNQSKSNRAVNRINLELQSLKIKFTAKTQEIANLQIQLNGQNVMGAAIVDNCPPPYNPYNEKDDEREQLLPLNTAPY